MFRESPIRYRSASSSFRAPGTTVKMLGSTSSSFGAAGRNNSGANLLRMSQTGMRRSSYSSIKNTQGRLDDLHDNLAYIEDDVKQTRNVTKEASLYLKFMKDDLLNRRLPEIDATLRQQIVGLKKQVSINERSQKLRFDGIWQNMDCIHKNNRNISGQLLELKARMEKIEQALGYYNGFDKHRY